MHPKKRNHLQYNINQQRQNKLFYFCYTIRRIKVTSEIQHHFLQEMCKDVACGKHGQPDYMGWFPKTLHTAKRETIVLEIRLSV